MPALNPYPLKYAHVERERRFLVRAVPSGVVLVLDVEDAYIDGTRLRLRQVASEGETVRKLGHKVRLGDGPQEIACTSMYLDDQEWQCLSALPARRLHKRRHIVERDGYRCAVDEFDDRALVAEFDNPPAGRPVPPPWLDVIREVTLDESWTGLGRARSGLAKV